MKILKSILKWFALLMVLLVVVYFLGPRPKFDPVNLQAATLDIELGSLDTYIQNKESQIADLKPDNEARVVWADSSKTRTEYSVVYLPGFSASQEEGDPVHENFAKRYGLNLYLARIYDHGRKSEDTFKGLTPADLINSAKEAIAIGKLLGEKVILMGCSTGATYAIPLAGEDDDVVALMLYSPNIDIYDQSSNIVTGPWGKQLLGLVMGGEYNRLSYDPEPAKYWTNTYHTDGIIAMKSLIEETMTKDIFKKIDKPVFLSYYYKNEAEQDFIVSVDRMHDFFDQISTPAELKVDAPMPETGHHVISSHVFSKDIGAVIDASYEFGDEILKLSKSE